MSQIVALIVLIGVSFSAVIKPWIGVLFSYLVVVMGPQYIWFWAFGDIRPAYWIIIATIIGVALEICRGECDFRILFQKTNKYLIILWGTIILSYLFGPYVNISSQLRQYSAEWGMETYNKIFILYFLGCLCIKSTRRMIALCLVCAVSVVYFSYWANMQYLNGLVMGRLSGPVNPAGMGNYADENAFAMLFVVSLPFLWSTGQSLRNKWLKGIVWVVIPFGWHAIFLTGSRGGLVGMVVALIFTLIRSKNKTLCYGLVIAFAVCFFWQAGDLMKSRANTINEYESDYSALGRLEAWEAAAKMILDHPLTGVGIVSFTTAFPDYSDKKPREAHNSLLQLSAEAGVIAGIVYVLVVITVMRDLWVAGNRMRTSPFWRNSHLYYYSEGLLVSFAGLISCSLFLSLQMYEIFYLWVLLSSSVKWLSDAVEHDKSEVAVCPK